MNKNLKYGKDALLSLMAQEGRKGVAIWVKNNFAASQAAGQDLSVVEAEIDKILNEMGLL